MPLGGRFTGDAGRLRHGQMTSDQPQPVACLPVTWRNSEVYSGRATDTVVMVNQVLDGFLFQV